MALWGNKDDKTSTGTVTIAANGLVTGSSTKFETEARVGDYIVANDDNFLIKSITSNTVAQVIAGTAGGTIVAVGAGNNYALSEKPKSLTVSEVHKGNISGNPEAVFGVDTDEPDLFSSSNENSNSEDLLSSSQNNEEEKDDDLEIPAFLRRQKN